MFVGYIYCITNSKNNKQYIGQTSMSVDKRYKDHLKQAKNGGTQLLYLAMNKYGVDNFYVETVLQLHADSREELKKLLNEYEIKYIEEYNSYKPNGYNMTHGGDSFSEHVVVPVFKVDADGNVLQYYKSMIDAENDCGIRPGSIYRAYMYQTHYAGGWFWYRLGEMPMAIGDNIGKQNNKYTPVDMYSLDGEYIKTFDSIADAAREVGCSHSTISGACQKDRLSASGYKWAYRGDTPTMKKKKTRGRPVIQIDTKNNKPIKEYKSLADAARDNNLQSPNIYKCCIGKRNTAGGYRWCFSV